MPTHVLPTKTLEFLQLVQSFPFALQFSQSPKQEEQIGLDPSLASSKVVGSHYVVHVFPLKYQPELHSRHVVISPAVQALQAPLQSEHILVGLLGNGNVPTTHKL